MYRFVRFVVSLSHSLSDSDDDRQQERIVLSTFVASALTAGAKAAICQNVNGDFFQDFRQSLNNLRECAKNSDLNACLETAVAAIAKFIPGAQQAAAIANIISGGGK